MAAAGHDELYGGGGDGGGVQWNGYEVGWFDGEEGRGFAVKEKCGVRPSRARARPLRARPSFSLTRHNCKQARSTINDKRQRTKGKNNRFLVKD